MTRQEFAHQLAQYRLQSTRRLPIAYQEVEYIKSTGTQYIDTGFAPTNETGVKLSFYKESFSPETENNQAFFGALNSSESHLFGFRLRNVSWQVFFGSGETDYFLTPYGTFPLTGTIEVNFKNSGTAKISENGQQRQYTLSIPPFEWDKSIFIFAQNHPSIMWYAKYCLKSMQITQGNDLIRDFVPCYRVSDNVAGLYDLVNGVFYTNAGTGTFAVGPDVGKGSIKFDGGIKCYLPSVKFYGACAQDGTPTPEAPVPIKCNDSKWTMNGSGGTVDLSLLPDGGLYGIGNVRDEWDAATGKGIRRCGKINSYAGEPVGDNWISSTGALTTGATVIYELSEPVPFTATPQPIIEQNGSNRLSQTDGDIDDTDAEATFVQHS